MKQFALILMACLLAVPALATFEIADPANDVYKEETEEEKAYRAYREQKGLLCSVDTDSGECWCIDKDNAQKLEMSQPECQAVILKTLSD